MQNVYLYHMMIRTYKNDDSNDKYDKANTNQIQTLVCQKK